MNSDHPETWQAGIAAPAPEDARIVVVHSDRPSTNPHGHECTSQNLLAAHVAALLGYRYGGEYDAAESYDLPLYFVPRDTLPDPAQATRMGIRSEHDLFGGVVPLPFVGSKVITHPLVHPQAAAPHGWSSAFGERVRDVALPGYSAFSLKDAVAAGRPMLAGGAVRTSSGCGSAISASKSPLATSNSEPPYTSSPMLLRVRCWMPQYDA